MGRNIRNIPSGPLTPFDAVEVAPHRYLYETFDTSFRDAANYAEWKKGVPYKTGEIIWIDRDGRAVKAHILSIYIDPVARERLGERREVYRCRYETKSGAWSRNWIDVYPGKVQRGYQRAGLAPDVDRWNPLPKA